MPSTYRSRSTSRRPNWRYPDAVRAGRTRPSASRKRIFEMVTSGNSVRSSASTSPMLNLRVIDGCAVTVRSSVVVGPAGIEREPELADLDLVSVVKRRLLDAFPVDVGAVEAADIANQERVLRGTAEIRVLVGDVHVVQDGVSARMAAA